MQRAEKVTGSGWSVRSKLILTVVLVMVITIGGQALLSVLYLRSRTEQSERRQLKALYQHYRDDIKGYQDAAAAIARAFAAQNEIAELLARHDRDALHELLEPVFQDMRERFDLTHLYVHEPNGVVFLRVHNRRDFGDTSIVYRSTLRDAIGEQETIAGVEFDHNRLGVRGVAPILRGDTLAGLVEVGLDYDRGFVAEMKERTGADYRLWVTREAAGPTGLWPQDDLPRPPLQELFYYAGTAAEAPRAPVDFYRQVLSNGEPRAWLSLAGNGSHAVLVAPLMAYGDRVIGAVEIISSREPALAAIRTAQTRAVLVAAGLALAGLLLLAAMIRAFVLRPLDKLASVAERQFRGELRARATSMPPDEFGRLGDTFNRLSDQLTATLANQEQTIEELREAQANLARYRDTLEERVEERTRELEEAQHELVERERLATLGRLTATVSHELRNPLATISSSVYTVRELVAGLGMATVHRALDRAERNIRRCDAIIEELLDYTRRREIILQPTDLDHWLHDVLEEMPVPGGVAVGWGLECGTRVDLNPSRFRRLLVNVVTNACEAILQGEQGTGTVSIGTERRGEQVVLSVRDNGPGIPPETLERIFEPLFSTKGFGVGLGMAIVQQVAEQHNATVDVESHVGEGTTVRIALPVSEDEDL